MVRQDSLLQERYRIVRQLGRGGMGTVYEATDEKFGTPVALKEIIFETSDAKQRELLGNAFQREAKSLATARHECVPFVRDHFHEDNYQYLVMELVEGDDLGRLLEDRKKPFYLDEVIDWMRQLLDALDYLHNLDPPIIHRDIKPNNLKLTSRKRLKLLDFGIAKSGEISAVTTKNQTFVGATLEYSPIEQMLHVVDATFREFLILQHETSTKEILGQRTDARADIFSAGSTFYHLLTGQLPEYATKRALALWEGRPDPLPHPSDLNASIPRRFGDFLLTAMSIARDDRFASAAEMLATLEIVASAKSESVPATRAKTARLSKKPAAHIMPPNVPPVEREMADIDPALAETDPALTFPNIEVPSTNISASPNLKPYDSDNISDRKSPQSVKNGPVSIATFVRPRAKRSWVFPALLGGFLVVGVTIAAGVWLNSSRGAEEIPIVNESPPNEIPATSQGDVRQNAIGMEFVYLAGGKFMMGSSEAEIDQALSECKEALLSIDEKSAAGPAKEDCRREWFSLESPQHRVTIKDGFWMGKYEVTQGEWKALMGNDPSKIANCGTRCPVENVSWDDTQTFLKLLNEKGDGFEYSLPSEAEWEFAARADQTTVFAFGNSLNSTQANFHGSYPYASAKGKYVGKKTAVGTYKPNAWGLHDMHGNIWEWVQDVFNSGYSELPNDGSANASVGDLTVRVLRGGSWKHHAGGIRSASRERKPPTYRSHLIGFRVLARAE